MLNSNEIRDLRSRYDNAMSDLRHQSVHLDLYPLSDFLQLVPPSLDPQKHKLTKRFVDIIGDDTRHSSEDGGDGFVRNIPFEWKITDKPLPSGKQVRIWQECHYLFFCIRDGHPLAFLLSHEEATSEVVKKQSLTHRVKTKKKKYSSTEIITEKIDTNIGPNRTNFPEWISRYHLDISTYLLQSPHSITTEDRDQIFAKIEERLAGKENGVQRIMEVLEVEPSIFEIF